MGGRVKRVSARGATFEVAPYKGGKESCVTSTLYAPMDISRYVIIDHHIAVTPYRFNIDPLRDHLTSTSRDLHLP